MDALQKQFSLNRRATESKFPSAVLLVDIDSQQDNGCQLLSHWVHHPIGLMYLASEARKSFPDISFHIFHTALSNNPVDEIKSIINKIKPDFIGLRSLSIAKSMFQKIAQSIKESNPDLPVIAGGPYPSTAAASVLCSKTVDLVVIGEGESTFVELITRFSNDGTLPQDLDGTAVLDKNIVRYNNPRKVISDIDAIAFPDYSLINPRDYRGFSNHAFQDTSASAFICSSRGCPFGCFYCHKLFGKKIRRRSAHNIVAEMRQHCDERGIRNFVFLDDLFNVPAQAAKEILSLMIKELPGVHINFPNGLRADHIDDELLDLLEKAGTVQMALAVETASPRLQKMIGKNLDLGKAKKSIKTASERFAVCGFFMVGFPTETYDEAMHTIEYASEFDHMLQPVLSVLRVYKSTPLFELLKPNEEQERLLVSQETEMLQPHLSDSPNFYGDIFSNDQVPLKSADIEKLRWQWMHDVISNKSRINNSHKILSKYLNHDQTLEFYRNFFNKKTFNDRSLELLLKQ